jgi:hypothetical protein
MFSFSLLILIMHSRAGTSISPLAPPSSRGGPLPADLARSVSEALEADDNQDRDDAEELEEDTSSSTSLPPVQPVDTGLDKKRKRVDKFASSSSSFQQVVTEKSLVLTEDMDLFDLLAS